MKRLYHISIFIAVIAVPLLTHAQTWNGYSLWNDNEETTPSSLAVIYQGSRYDPPLRIDRQTNVVDRSPPETLLASLLYAINHLDEETYNALFHPGERLTEFAPSTSITGSVLYVRRLIKFGEFSIMQIEVTNSRTSFPALVSMRMVNESYYMSHLIKTNKAFSLLNYYYAFTPFVGKPREQEIATSNLFSGEFVYLTNRASGDTDGPPLIFRFQGHVYGPSAILNQWPERQHQDLTSPTGALCAAISALKTNDIDWYSTLLHPLEKTNRVQYGMEGRAKGKIWEEWVRQAFSEAVPRAPVGGIRLDREIYYLGDCAAVIFEDATRPVGTTRGWLGFRRHGTNWFISDKLNGSSNPLIEYLGCLKDLRTKPFPYVTE
jgi:hypothetical protein